MDLHMIRSTECPSRLATATEGVLFPKLSSVALTCGMALAVTVYERSSITDADVDAFIGLVRETDHQLMRTPAMTAADMEQVVRFGARAIVDKHDLPESI